MKLPRRQYTDLSETNKEVIKVDSSVKFAMSEPLLDDPKERVKYIKKIESTIRSSFEYKNYIKFLKDELDITRCKFLKNIDVKDTKVGLEMHHYPFTLYDIVDTVLEKYLKSENGINELLIAEEVMKLHYENKVGLVPLTITVHQLVHAGQLFIPTNFVYGNYAKFMQEYDKYIIELHKTYVSSIESTTRKIMEGDLHFNTDILKMKAIEIEDPNCDKTKDMYINREDLNDKIS